ncbi:DUF3000 domain-containing protein [Streptomyces zingiberis]|uniref:DUF3000 domain-containing protein n=1 Tax=Streptomyces zingiberis TaxID=2053010 RepID=A0ABX1BZU7_9ACTN|nr:DUF3000 domain-containing protein [Streptomyces zingiberis]NJQ01062.1 DUF3000 domain-containing protein [Streptomyces zingiberis]
MAAAQGPQGQRADGPDHGGGDETPAAFRKAVDGLNGARLRPETEVTPARAPGRLAPYAHAVEAAVVQDGEELAEGRLVLLHDPAGHNAWQGTFRLVTLIRAELEPEMATDPLLPEVCWSWLTGAFDSRGVAHQELSGTVTLAGSYYFGGLGDRPPATQIEIRASWTPREDGGGAPDTGAHLTAWCELLCQIGGLPPTGGVDAAVVTLPQRRGPRQR